VILCTVLLRADMSSVGAAVASSASLSATEQAAAQYKAAKELVEEVNEKNETVRTVTRKEIRTQNLRHRSTYVFVINKR
jgi:hypothetical protein